MKLNQQNEINLNDQSPLLNGSVLQVQTKLTSSLMQFSQKQARFGTHVEPQTSSVSNNNSNSSHQMESNLGVRKENHTKNMALISKLSQNKHIGGSSVIITDKSRKVVAPSMGVSAIQNQHESRFVDSEINNGLDSFLLHNSRNTVQNNQFSTEDKASDWLRNKSKSEYSANNILLRTNDL